MAQNLFKKLPESEKCNPEKSFPKGCTRDFGLGLPIIKRFQKQNTTKEQQKLK